MKAEPSDDTSARSHGESSTTDESTSRQSTVSEEAERGSGDEKQAQTASTEDGCQKHETEYEAERTPKRRKVEVNGVRSANYRTLFESTSRNTSAVSNSGNESLASSSVGGSLWTSEEKQGFFSALPFATLNDVTALLRAVPTKSSIEIDRYLQLLRSQNDSEPAATQSLDETDFGGDPAAFEIGDECDEVLNLAAGSLAVETLRHDVEVERERFGDSWLIDEKIARQVEDLLESATPIAETTRWRQSSEESHLVPTVVPPMTSQDPSGAMEQDEATARSTLPLHIPSAALVRPAALLDLSRTLFMNNASPTTHNWRDLASSTLTTTVSPTPSLFHSALDSLHTLILTATRRLVHATLIQADSRLRAKSGWSQAGTVRASDVRAAADMLEWRPEWDEYWVGVARRCGVEVFTESKRYGEGRVRTRRGFEMTYEEVEEELGHREGTEEVDGRGKGKRRRDEEETERLGEYDDYVSPTSFYGQDASVEYEETQDQDGSEVGNTSITTGEQDSDGGPRRWFASEGEEASGTNAVLDSLDQHVDGEEEERLLALLGYPQAES